MKGSALSQLKKTKLNNRPRTAATEAPTPKNEPTVVATTGQRIMNVRVSPSDESILVEAKTTLLSCGHNVPGDSTLLRAGLRLLKGLPHDRLLAIFAEVKAEDKRCRAGRGE